mgnify:FL=1
MGIGPERSPRQLTEPVATYCAMPGCARRRRRSTVTVVRGGDSQHAYRLGVFSRESQMAAGFPSKPRTTGHLRPIGSGDTYGRMWVGLNPRGREGAADDPNAFVLRVRDPCPPQAQQAGRRQAGEGIDGSASRRTNVTSLNRAVSRERGRTTNASAASHFAVNRTDPVTTA